MKDAKVKQGMVLPVCLALMMAFVWIGLGASPAIAKDYAVQIAALRSQQNAEDLRRGLLAQGLEAYWVKIVLPEHGLFYRVRLGKFSSVEKAYSYAESLLNSGLLESYAITLYETPMSDRLRDTMQASIEVQEYVQQRPSPNETSELLAAIGNRQWWIPVNRNLFSAVPQLPPVNAGMTRREMLVFTLGRQEWRLNHDLSVLFVRAPVAPENTNLASTRPEINSITTIPRPVNPPAAIATGVKVAPAPRPVEQAFASSIANAPLTPPPPPGAMASTVVVTANRQPISAANLNAARNPMPEIGRGGRTTASKGIGYGRIAPPRLQATAEMRDGQLMMKLRNLDQDRSFAGTANLTLSDDRNSNEISPMRFDLPPDSEIVLPVNETLAQGGNWMLMVFDEGGILRLIRGATFGQKTAPPQPPQTQSAQAGDGELNPPQYITGIYDATGGSSQIQPQGIPSATDSSNPSMSGAVNPSQNAVPNDSATANETPGQLTVTPRQIAATTENVTLEFDIASPNPLQYISVTLAAGEYRDTRQALMSTTRGRVPFLVPAMHATGTFMYEIKDEAGRVLAGGVGDFRQLAGGR